MMYYKMTIAEARCFLVKYHGFYEGLKGKEGILKLFDRIKSIQYDPLNVVSRNADLVINARITDYDSSMLYELLYEDRTLVDGWDKMMGIYQSSDYPLMKHIRESKEKEVKSTLRHRNQEEALELLEDVLTYVRTKGPSFARDIRIGKCTKGRWGTGKLSSAALDYLYHVGLLGIHSKKNAEKKYDLIDNLLCDDLLKRESQFAYERDFIKWYVKRRIFSVGLLWIKNGGGWLGHYLSDRKLRQSILDELISEGTILEVQIEGIKEVFYVNAESIELLNTDLVVKSNSVRFIAPLDNLLWDRDMLKVIFDFDYRCEVYTPVVKRKYGYYVLPVLFKERFIGRVEFDHVSKLKKLVIKNWWWEEGIEITEEIREAIYYGLNEFARYLKVEELSEETINNHLQW